MRRVVLQLPILVVVFALLLSCGAPEVENPSTGATTGPRSAVLVVLDGVRPDFVGAWGGADADTPNLDALAADGIRFEWTFTQSPLRGPALASILTALYPTTSGVVEADDFLVEEAVTLAEVASAAGLSTAAFAEDLSDEAGLSQGFATFEVSPEPGAAVARWIGAQQDGPFLAAAVLGPPPATLSDVEPDEARVAYRAFVDEADAAVGAVLDALRATGAEDRVTVAVVSATGFELGEHGVVGEALPYATVTRVPMILRPAGGAAGVVVSDEVEAIDLMPTLLEQLGLAAPEQAQGASLLALAAGQGRPPYIAFGESPFEQFVAMAGYGMVVTSEGERRLFDLSADPLELDDIAADEEHRVDVLTDHLEAWSKMVAAASLDPERRIEELDDATLEQLRSLGYIQ
jgi:arylsulfatase A-like enzyme